MIVGLDLAAKPENPTGIALLDNFSIKTKIVHTDKEILDCLGDASLVAIDAPLSMPDKGKKMRPADLEIRKLAHSLPPTFGPMKMLTERAIRIKQELEKAGVKVAETFPKAVEKLIPEGLEFFGFSESEGISEHEYDAALAAFTAWCFKYNLHKNWEGIVTPSKRALHLMRVQRKKSNLVRIEPLGEVQRIAAVDVSYKDDIARACAVCSGFINIVEQKVKFPYIPSLLAFREMPVIEKAVEGLDFDLLVVGGHGIAHPRGCGLATHLGVELEKPVIGVARELLVGEEKDDKIYWNRQQVGIKQRGHYITIGNRVDLQDLEKYAETGVRLLSQAHELAKI